MLGQSAWDAKRAEAKAKAAEVVKADAVKALAAKNAHYGIGTAPSSAPAPASVEDGDDEPYEEWTNADLSAELQSRELPHTGNKDELVARLIEDDEAAEGSE